MWPQLECCLNGTPAQCAIFMHTAGKDMMRYATMSIDEQQSILRTVKHVLAGIQALAQMRCMTGATL